MEKLKTPREYVLIELKNNIHYAEKHLRAAMTDLQYAEAVLIGWQEALDIAMDALNDFLDKNKE